MRRRYPFFFSRLCSLALCARRSTKRPDVGVSKDSPSQSISFIQAIQYCHDSLSCPCDALQNFAICFSKGLYVVVGIDRRRYIAPIRALCTLLKILRVTWSPKKCTCTPTPCSKRSAVTLTQPIWQALVAQCLIAGANDFLLLADRKALSSTVAPSTLAVSS